MGDLRTVVLQSEQLSWLLLNRVEEAQGAT
jgi:hypothetical protein